MTGLAAGDHLHFTVLVNGTAVESRRVVGYQVDAGPRVPQGHGSRRQRDIISGLETLE